MKINLMENIFGINKIENLNFSKNFNLIYANNGLMKTSFFKGMKIIFNGGKIPNDAIWNLQPKYEISLNNKTYTHNKIESNQKVICFSHQDIENSIFGIDNLKMLMGNEKILNKIKDIYKQIDININQILNILKKVFGIKKEEKIYIELNKLLNKEIKNNYDIVKFFQNKINDFFPNKIKSIKIFKKIRDKKIEKLAKNSKNFLKYKDFLNKIKNGIFTD